jgi:hypothetical protein
VIHTSTSRPGQTSVDFVPVPTIRCFLPNFGTILEKTITKMMIMQINPTVLSFQESVKIDFRDISRSIENLFDTYEVDRLVNTDLNPLRENETSLTDNDVICGRSRLAHAHPGNKRFRCLIRKYSCAYQSTRLREEKKTITMAIINTISKSGGRFLRFDERESIFYKVNPNYRYEKVSHSLRSFKSKSCKSQKLTCEDLEPIQLTDVDYQMEHIDSTMLESMLKKDEDFPNPNHQDKIGVVVSESTMHDYEPLNDFQSVDMKLDEKIVDLLSQL